MAPPEAAPRVEAKKPSTLRRVLFSTLRIVVAVVLALLLFQNYLLFHPSRYEEEDLDETAALFTQLKFQTSAGDQTAFYLPPSRNNPAPRRIWVVFHGNASKALDFRFFAKRFGDPKAAFLLLDYPGYGFSEGSPSRASITSMADAAVVRLAEHLGARADDLETSLGLVGHSMGAAAALEFAADHPGVRAVVLAAPYSSLMAMARRTVGWPLCLTLRQRYDNKARLAEIAQFPNPPRVFILHGSEDAAIPPAQSAELQAEFPQLVTRVEARGATHESVLLDKGERQLYAWMRSVD